MSGKTDMVATRAPTPVVFMPMVSREAVYAEAPAGQTLAQILGAQAACSLRVMIGGVEVPRSLWARVRPRPGVRVVVEFYPQGGGSARKWILTIVAIVATVFTYGAASGAAWAAVGGLSATTVAIGGALIAGLAVSMIPPPVPKVGGMSGDPLDQLKSLTGTQNNANPYGAIPLVMGTWVYFPTHAAMPYTEVSGDDQYMRMLLELGYGTLDISDIKIGETPIESFDGVEYEVTTTPTLFTQDIYEFGVGTTFDADADTDTRTSQTGATELSIDLQFPQGLYVVDKKGKTLKAGVYWFVKFRKVGDADWSNVAHESTTGVTFSGSVSVDIDSGLFYVENDERETLRIGIRWKVPAADQYEVTVTRTGTYHDDDTVIVNEAVWTVLRSISPRNPTSTGTTKLAIRIKATDQLQGVVSTLSVKSSQRIRRWDMDTSTWLEPAPTQNPAWIYLWMLTDCPGATRHYTDDQIDLDGIARWAADCEANGYVYSGVADAVRVFSDVAKDVMACGLASSDLRNGKQSVVRDIAQTVAMNLYTPINNTSLSYSRLFATPPHALRCAFTNPGANYQQDERVVYWDGYDATTATHIEKMDLRNVIDADAVWKIARYHLAVMWLRPNTYELQVDAEYLFHGRGDLVEVADSIIGWGLYYGRVKAIDGDRVVLDTTVQMDPAKTYMMRVRNDDATLDSTQPGAVITWDSTHIRFDMDMAWDDTTDAPTSVVTMNPPIGVHVGDLFVLGEEQKVTLPVVISAIEPGQSMLQRSAKLTVVDAAPGVWTAAAGTPPPFVSQITGKLWCSPPDPPNITIRIGKTLTNFAGISGGGYGGSAGGGSGGSSGSGIYRMPLHNRNVGWGDVS